MDVCLLLSLRSVSPSRVPVLSVTHYVQAPATQATYCSLSKYEKKNVERSFSKITCMFSKNEVDILRVFNRMDVRQSDRKLHRISTKYSRIFLYTFCHMLDMLITI